MNDLELLIRRLIKMELGMQASISQDFPVPSKNNFLRLLQESKLHHEKVLELPNTFGVYINKFQN